MAKEVVEFIATFIRVFKEILIWLIIVRVILSWFRLKPNSFTRFITNATNPIFYFVRKIVPPMGILDLSPILAYFLVELAAVLLLSLLDYVYALI